MYFLSTVGRQSANTETMCFVKRRRVDSADSANVFPLSATLTATGAANARPIPQKQTRIVIQSGGLIMIRCSEAMNEIPVMNSGGYVRPIEFDVSQHR